MKIQFTATRKLKQIIVDEDRPYFWFYFCSFIIPLTSFALIAPFGFGAAAVGALITWALQMMFATLISPSRYEIQNAFFCWIPSILLSPITVPVDFFSSIGKVIWSEFSRQKAAKKIRKAWTHLINRGLDPKKIEVDVMGKSTKSLPEIASSLFAEIISDQLGRAPIEEFENGISEEIVVIRVERHGDKICLIGSLTISERNPREDGSYNSTVQGRVFGITFSVSEHTRVCKVVHHTSRSLSDVHEDEQLEDLWFELTSSSGVLTDTAIDPWQRRVSKNFASGVICDTPPVEQENSSAEELA